MPKTPDVEQQSPISGSDCQSETEMNMPQIQITVVSPPRSPESPISTNSESTSPLPSPISPPIKKSTRYVYKVEKYHKKSFQHLTMFLMSTQKSARNLISMISFWRQTKTGQKSARLALLSYRQTCTRLQFFVISTPAIAKIISAKNARAWVSMVL